MKLSTVAVNAALFVYHANAVPSPLSTEQRATLNKSLRSRYSNRHASRPPIQSSGNGTGSASTADSAVEYYDNWSGAIQNGNDITVVSGVINTPNVGVPPGGNSGTQYGGVGWVGIDGTSSCHSTLLQTGIEWLIENGEVQYYAWWEWLPAPFTYFDNFPIEAGDEIFMKVEASSTTSGTAYITNQRTGQSVSKNWSNQPAICLLSAEWIVEDFTDDSDNSLAPFAEFSPISITEASWVAGGVTYDLSGATVADIRQNGDVLTDCELNGDSEVDCSYIGGSLTGPTNAAPTATSSPAQQSPSPSSSPSTTPNRPQSHTAASSGSPSRAPTPPAETSPATSPTTPPPSNQTYEAVQCQAQNGVESCTTIY